MKVHRSAFKHGVLPEDAIQAADLSLWIEPLEEEEWSRRELRLGFDTQARLRETGSPDLQKRRGDGHPRDARPPTVLGPPALNAHICRAELGRSCRPVSGRATSQA